ncbi:MAG: UrcA family protein [Sphingopyxis sp.]|nr:UrcA family protein [Sphingopyxis sp.]
MKIRLWALPLALSAFMAPAVHAANQIETTLRIDISDIAPGDRSRVERRVGRAIREFCRSEASNIDPRARRAERRCVAEHRQDLAAQLDSRAQLAALARR